jgi:hypothetical protein
MAGKRTPDLRGVDHAFAWSYTEFLLGKSSRGVRDLVIRLKERKPLRESVKELFGFNYSELEAAWIEHVKTTYRERLENRRRR